MSVSHCPSTDTAESESCSNNVYLGHSRDQSEDRNSSLRTHRTDRRMYRERLGIIKHNVIKTTEENFTCLL